MPDEANFGPCRSCLHWSPQPGQDGLVGETRGVCGTWRAWRWCGWQPAHTWPRVLDSAGCPEWNRPGPEPDPQPGERARRK